MKKKRNGKSREILLVNSSVGCPYFVKISPINREKGIKNENQFISTQQRSSVLRPFVFTWVFLVPNGCLIRTFVVVVMAGVYLRARRMFMFKAVHLFPVSRMILID